MGFFSKKGRFFAFFFGKRALFRDEQGAFQGGVGLNNFLRELCDAEEAPTIKKTTP